MILKYIPPSSHYWTESSRLLLLPSSSHSVPQNDNTNKSPVLLCSFQWTEEEVLWVPPQRLPHMPEGPGRGGMLDFLLKTTKVLYTIHIQTQGHPWYFFFFPFTRINSLKPSHYSICCTAHSDSCLPTWDFQQASKTCFWMPRTWRTNHTNTNNLMLLQSNQY